jgi:hypothetical protein
MLFMPTVSNSWRTPSNNKRNELYRDDCYDFCVTLFQTNLSQIKYPVSSLPKAIFECFNSFLPNSSCNAALYNVLQIFRIWKEMKFRTPH